jgi:hypothetical protein
MSDHKVYSIPARFRRIENLHILLWLIKDLCWALNYKTVAMIMIVPTMAVALMITWQTRHILSEVLHNLAVVFWITANCTWMVGEFYGWDENLIGEIGLRQLAVIPFSIGLIILAYYYIFLASKASFREKMFHKAEEAVRQEIRNEK